ncbi:MAG: hypothetical protein KKC76_08225 [Proteobacteria bacterium]|nr:hypothetical protein [Pseudomonadota bacterium]MBU4298083.1 hypothetical protein [Pseudomonadota bacterium]MCG2746318.1 hypothetical protein [Desulfobulbaceae bacterium]
MNLQQAASREKNVIQLSINESINRLKVEIIAQDWGLSAKRIDLLEAAFFCLKQRFKNRKAAHAILIMAGSVLEYVKRKGESTPSESIDFLKEAMAHIVNLYESDEFDLEKDEKLFKGLYFRFNALKEKIKAEKTLGKAESDNPPAAQAVARQMAAPEDDFDEEALVPENIDQLRRKVLNLRESEIALDRSEVDRLVSDLQNSLERAEYVGETIRQLLTELLHVRNSKAAEGTEQDIPDDIPEDVRDDFPEDILEDMPDDDIAAEAPQSAPASGGGSSALSPQIAVEETTIKNCPATELRGITVADSHVYIQEIAIALVREVTKDKLQEYLKNSNVPLKDFGGFFKRLAKQFKGSLATIPDKKLKKLTLPIMVPAGHLLADVPDENGSQLVFVTNGQWNGVIVCSEVAREPVTMIKFKSAKNGDFVGIGFSEGGLELPLLNAVSILRREGFLTMV